MKSNILWIGVLYAISSLEAKSLKVDCLYRSPNQAKEISLQELETELFSPATDTVVIEINNPITAISYLRYFEPLYKAGKVVICKAPSSVHTLLSWCPFVSNIVSETDRSINASTPHVSIEKLAQILDAKNLTPTAEQSLHIDEAIKTAWQDAFITNNSFKIGVCCHSWFHEPYKTHPLTMDITSFFPLACMQHASLYSFDDLSAMKTPDLAHLYYFDEKHHNSYTDLATIISFMDLMITTEPMIVDLAYALGKKVWFIAPKNIPMNVHHYADLRTFTLSDQCNVIFDIMHELAYTIEKPASTIVTSEIATGELIDKMTILEIKTERITDQKKLDNIYKELHSLQRTFDEFVTMTPELEQLIQELKAANAALWTTEDLIRDKEREKVFDNEFVLLARSVYIQNDERCRVKREINELLGSRLVEEKSYKPYN